MDRMNKKTLVAVVVAGSMVTAPLFAANFFHKLMPVKQSVDSAINLHAKPLTQHESQNYYADFSGNWEGICSFADGNEMSMSLAIENDDQYLDLDGEELKIGPLHTETSSDKLGATFEHTSLEWNSDKTMLIMKILSFEKAHPSLLYKASNPMETFIGQITLFLNNGQLILKGQTLYLIDLEQGRGLSSLTCTFNKK